MKQFLVNICSYITITKSLISLTTTTRPHLLHRIQTLGRNRVIKSPVIIYRKEQCLKYNKLKWHILSSHICSSYTRLHFLNIRYKTFPKTIAISNKSQQLSWNNKQLLKKIDYEVFSLIITEMTCYKSYMSTYTYK